jgi:hypothetical protein
MAMGDAGDFVKCLFGIRFLEFTPNILRVIKPRRMKWTEHVWGKERCM